MPTRKQKRRREKDRRHEYEYVYVDEEGQEVEVDEPEPALATRGKDAKAPAKGKPKAKAAPGRARREPPEPSWSRSVRRAVPWQIGIIVLVVLVLRSGPLISRVMIGVLYGVLFVPMMYMTDRMVRNRWLKQHGGGETPRDKRPRRQ